MRKKLVAAALSAGFLVAGAGPALAGGVKVKANNIRVCNNRCLNDVVDVSIGR